MKDFLNPAGWPRSLGIGVGMALLCLPYMMQSSMAALVPIRAVMLVTVTTVCAQACRAWLPPELLLHSRGDRVGSWLQLLLPLLALEWMGRYLYDPYFALAFPGRYPSSFLGMALGLPWIMGFQPLIFAGFPAAMAWRLARDVPAVRRDPVYRRGAVLLAVIGVNLLVGLMQMEAQLGALPPGLRVMYVLSRGVRFVTLGWIYLQGGLPAAALASGLMWSRYGLLPL